ncbi:MAG: ABC transporter permease subunit, partial [Pirellulaceae bacterium]|nr:ABC transporter permease subunit [Pirellulaceae bacterium]
MRIGSKSFTESVILGEMLTSLAGCPQFAGDDKIKVKHLAELGGTQILWKALLSGDIDAYVEYSGTLQYEILKGQDMETLSQIVVAIDKLGVEATAPLGFNNTYALGMRKVRAGELKIQSISDLREHAGLKLGFSDEFIERSDGWGGLRERYSMPEFSVRGLDHSLAYRGLGAGSIDVIDLYSTDPEIISYDLQVLVDDLQHFPKYEALIVYRADLKDRHPDIVNAFKLLEGKIDSVTMAKLNADSRIRQIPENKIAIDFLHAAVDKNLKLAQVSDSRFQRRAIAMLNNTGRHLLLVTVSLGLAILVAVPLGIYSYKRPRWGRVILGIVGIIQTIPSMALLVFMIPLLGLGPLPAIVALFLYSLLPIVRGTYTGLISLPESIHESASALGLPEWARLKLIELPLASQQILSGIKTSAVINVGTATIGALIGAGGYGQPILTGIRLADISLILQGAVPAALLALAAQSLFGWLERFLV